MVLGPQFPYTARERVIMSIRAILLPVFVEVALTFGPDVLAGVRACTARCGVEKPGSRTSPSASRTGRRGPSRSAMLRNQFQLPVLFYVLTDAGAPHALCRCFVRGVGMGFRGHALGPRLHPHQFEQLCQRRFYVFLIGGLIADGYVGRFYGSYSSRGSAMTPAARLAAAIEVFAAIDERAPAGGRRAEKLGPRRIASPAPATARPSPVSFTTRCAGAPPAPGSWAPTRRARFSSAC